jgi:hypothetical protein
MSSNEILELNDKLDELEIKDNDLILKLKIGKEKLEECIKWCKTKPTQITKTPELTVKEQKFIKKKEENMWGNDIINKNTGQWTTTLGENLVYDILLLKGENPRKVKKKGGFIPDWETDKYIYEVKTSNWRVDGTAGEKVLGTFIKYQDIPELYGKPLKIVCLANQEYELEFGKTPYFGEKVSPKTKQLLELAKSWDIEYIRFSDLIKDLNFNS